MALSMAVQVTHGVADTKPLLSNMDVCTTAQCVTTAADIIRDLRLDVDPCEDFSTYTCGGFQERESIPADEESTGYFKIVRRKNDRIIQSIFTSDTISKFDIEAAGAESGAGADAGAGVGEGGRGDDQDTDAENSNLQKLKALFHSCMDEETIDKVGRQPVLDRVQKLLSLFPVKEEGNVLSQAVSDASTTTTTTTASGANDDDKGDDTRTKKSSIDDATAAETPRRKALAMTIAHFTQLGLDIFTGFGVSTDVKNPSRKVLEVSEGGLGLPSKEYYLDNKTLAIYESTIGQMFTLIFSNREKDDDVDDTSSPPVSSSNNNDSGSDNQSKAPENESIGDANSYYDSQSYISDEVDDSASIISAFFSTTEGAGTTTTLSSSSSTFETTVVVPDKWAKVARDVVAFEIELASISTDIRDLRSSEKSYNPRTLSEIAALTPAIDWGLLLEQTLAIGTRTATTTATRPDSMIIVNSPGFHTRLQQLLDRTSLTTLQHYFTWSLIRQMAGDLSLKIRQPLRELHGALSGVSTEVIPERWKTCVGVINSQLGDMAGQHFVEKAFKGNSREVVEELIHSLRRTFSKDFQTNVSWLDDFTKGGASDKMESIVQLIGYSRDAPNVGSSVSIERYYRGLEMNASDYFGNKLRVDMWSVAREFRELGNVVNRQKMHMSPQTVNAYYSPTLNGIVFPAGILQQPFFHVENPEYINYGGIGVVAGHELTWWSNSTLEAFQTKAQCFVNQYGNFTIKDEEGRDHHLNGELTLGENIADNGGLKKSFETWNARHRSDPLGKRYKNFKLPGLEQLTAEQLFFISYARPWCTKQRPAAMLKQIRTDPHSLAQWRINGAVQNSAHFAKAFKCKQGTAMNPKDKCDLW
ncbi:hypothetical protein BG004_001802 [Podila humilis]|nr:hypothetical protein BG004_001802 [Podila humilis]